LKETAATAYVDGQNGLGPVVGNYCMDLAIKKAKGSGVGWVVAKGVQNMKVDVCQLTAHVSYKFAFARNSQDPTIMALLAGTVFRPWNIN
jgi:LDH2 family malate/lactate/ureidoglycolate dehydrogenase